MITEFSYSVNCSFNVARQIQTLIAYISTKAQCVESIPISQSSSHIITHFELLSSYELLY